MVKLSDEQMWEITLDTTIDSEEALRIIKVAAKAQLRAVVEDLRLRECNCARTGLWTQERAIQEIRLEYEAELEEAPDDKG